MAYMIYINQVTGQMEELNDKELDDMILKRVMDSRRMQRVRAGTSKLCVLCGIEFLEWGNDPWPLASKGWCCDRCNATKVIPARLKQL
jgi:hypothetical protein